MAVAVEAFVVSWLRGRRARSQPFSSRLGEVAGLLVADEARRSGRSRNAVVEELAEEAAKTRLFPSASAARRDAHG